MRIAIVKFIALVALALASAHVAAQTWGPVDAHVTVIDPSQMGNPAGSVAIYFTVDADVGTCGSTGCCAGTQWLYWSPIAFTGTSPVDNDRQMVNAKAILSTLQVALVTGKNVRLYGYNIASGYCQASYVMSLSN